MQTAVIRQVIEAIPTAMVLFGPDQRVLLANAAAAALFGTEIAGRQASSFLRHPHFLDGLETCLDKGERGQHRIALVANGVDRYLSVHFSPLGTDAGSGALVSLEDQTALEQTTAMRRDFVANVSHELRTPLTALIGFIETLRGAARDDAEARERFLTIMERESGRMIRLVNDLLSLSRVEADERIRPSKQVDVIALLRGVLATQNPLATAMGVELVFEAPEHPVILLADSDQLVQVFHNLIENALKYGSSGKSVVVRLSQLDREPTLRGPAVQIEVIDKGDGIDPLHLPRLTERFYRVDTHRSREKGGTGLGLAIVKHIVNRHRGRLRIESDVGKGSRFIVILPSGGSDAVTPG
ncbi:MAG: ATP-binding protein [Albidovulum sp.]